MYHFLQYFELSIFQDLHSLLLDFLTLLVAFMISIFILILLISLKIQEIGQTVISLK